MLDQLTQSTKPLRQTTLCFLLRENEILLAMKKRGFGRGRWNGVGGKLQPGETIEQAVIREAQEEIGVTPRDIRKVAVLNFYFPAVPEDKEWNQQVIVYIARSWEGEPTESEEMAPHWFAFSAIPYDQMWDDDRYWLPHVLEGKSVTGHFLFGKDEKLKEYKVVESI